MMLNRLQKVTMASFMVFLIALVVSVNNFAVSRYNNSLLVDSIYVRSYTKIFSYNISASSITIIYELDDNEPFDDIIVSNDIDLYSKNWLGKVSLVKCSLPRETIEFYSLRKGGILEITFSLEGYSLGNTTYYVATKAYLSDDTEDPTTVWAWFKVSEFGIGME